MSIQRHSDDEIVAEVIDRVSDRNKTDIEAWREYVEQDGSLWDATTAQLRANLRGMIRDDYSRAAIVGRRDAISNFYQEAEYMVDEPDWNMPDVPPNPAEEYVVSNEHNDLPSGTKKGDYLGNNNDVHALRPDEIQAICDNVPSPTMQSELLVRLSYQCGLRRGEVSRIRLKDIDRSAGERSIYIPDAHSKSKPRTVYYRPSLDFLLNQWIDVERGAVSGADESEYLFPSYGESGHIAPRHASRVVQKAAENAGIQEVMYHDKAGRPKYKITHHCLRHSFGLHSVLNGMSAKMLKELMGHESLDTTQKYMDAAERHVRHAAHTFGAGLSENDTEKWGPDD